MKKLLCAFGLLFSLSAFAQTGFIEVEVRDTIQIKPVSFIYNIRIGDGWSIYPPLSAEAVPAADVEYDVKEMEAEYDKKCKDLEHLLTKKGYTFQLLFDERFTISDALDTDKGFSVSLKSMADLTKLKKDLEGLDYISANVGDIDYGDETLYEKRLFEKLIAKARKKAETIALLSGLKVVRIAEVKESKETDNVSYNIANTYFALANNKMFSKKGNLYGTVSKGVIIKFETK